MEGSTLIDAPEELIDTVLTAATEVHRELGPGLYENIYHAALMIELGLRGLRATAEKSVNIVYKGHDLGIGLRADVIVEEKLLLELKAVSELTDNHLAQVITYLKALGLKRGFLLNFHERLLKDGMKRVSI
ncbi:MAG: GxxExxY protein [Candidatus Hydrogenedentes bacterium]|nr:GxxExxY protein [Candidatus Hydrogenedentota bacterium]